MTGQANDLGQRPTFRPAGPRALTPFATGKVSPDDLDAVRSAGATDEEIAETIGQVALNVLTNYFNKVADVDIAFPVVEV